MDPDLKIPKALTMVYEQERMFEAHGLQCDPNPCFSLCCSFLNDDNLFFPEGHPYQRHKRKND
jgi:hypothetical protein